MIAAALYIAVSCTQLAKQAEDVMSYRQAGGSQYAAYELFQNYNKAVIEGAYNANIGVDILDKRRVVRDYSNLTKLFCDEVRG